jgi:hypothetical protein
MLRHLRSAPIALLALAILAAPAGADVRGTLFEPPDFVPGTPQGQDGWSRVPLDPSIVLDHEIVATPAALTDAFGRQSLRISNAITNQNALAQTVSAPVIDAAGEPSSATFGITGGVRRSRFVASLRFASIDLGASGQQAGLNVSISPDNGLGLRNG